MKNLITFCILIIFLNKSYGLRFGSCPSSPVIGDFKSQSYVGTWYEIERFPSWFEYDLSCVTATYGTIDSNTISVQNKGIRLSSNSTSVINGTASAPSASEPNRLIVKFPINVFGFNVFNTNGKYDIWSVDYGKAALVYSCSAFIPGFLFSETAWILGRTKTLDDATISSLKSILSAKGINIGQFEKVKQVCNN